MPDYKKMYHILCSAASEAIDALPEEGRRILLEALDEAEEVYLQDDETEETEE